MIINVYLNLKLNKREVYIYNILVIFKYTYLFIHNILWVLKYVDIIWGHEESDEL